MADEERLRARAEWLLIEYGVSMRGREIAVGKLMEEFGISDRRAVRVWVYAKRRIIRSGEKLRA